MYPENQQVPADPNIEQVLEAEMSETERCPSPEATASDLSAGAYIH